MIDKSTIVQFLQTSTSQPIYEKDLIHRLHVDSDHRHYFKKLLRELIAGGDIVELKKNKISLPEYLDLVVGHLQVNRKGFAFVLPKRPGSGDLYISHEHLGNAFHGDLVVARVQRKKREKMMEGRSAEGQIIQVLQRGQNRIIGLYQEHGDYGFVIPEDAKLPYKIYVDRSNAKNAKPRQIVLAQILRYDEIHRNPEGEIVDILGYPDTQGMDEKIVIHTYGLPTAFPTTTLEAAEAVPDLLPEKETQQRLDLRDQCIFTIDGEKARDFDDAVSLERLENGNYQLGVHIADVNFYVKEGDPLDQEAYQRGTSVYFPESAIQMFPERLSSNLCSLREGEDRLTLSVFMELDPTMKMVNYDISPSVIRSQARLTYTAVRQMLKDDDDVLRKRYATFLPILELMQELSELLLQKRMRRGSLDFDLPEPEIVLDMQGNVENIFKAERNLAHRIIEEFMIIANETIASHLTWMQIPMVYRTHEKPEEKKVASLNQFLASLEGKTNAGSVPKGSRIGSDSLS